MPTQTTITVQTKRRIVLVWHSRVRNSSAAASERVDKHRHEQRDRHRQGRHIVRRLMDGEEYARKRQADAEGQNDNVQFRAELGAVDDQQNAAAGQKRKRRQLAEGGKELAEGALVAGIEKFGDRQVPD